MKVNYTSFYLILFVIILCSFSWYYVVIPGSVLFPDKRHPKPSVKTALTSYLTYILPTVLMIFYIRSSDGSDCKMLNLLVSYMSIVCKK